MHLVLAAPTLDRLDDLSADTALEWDSHDLLDTQFGQPEQVLKSWQDKFLFKEEDRDADIKALWPPQIGALHAIAAHFAVGQSFEPATIVLPTGTGKTETMLALQAPGPDTGDCSQRCFAYTDSGQVHLPGRAAGCLGHPV